MQFQGKKPTSRYTGSRKMSWHVVRRSLVHRGFITKGGELTPAGREAVTPRDAAVRCKMFKRQIASVYYLTVPGDDVQAVERCVEGKIGSPIFFERVGARTPGGAGYAVTGKKVRAFPPQPLRGMAHTFRGTVRVQRGRLTVDLETTNV